ncbi:Importin-7 [Sarcoptes scabiei]|uniref:Importin-7 n=1 Tax=Sarcoptes scabiei TaxID=52283 RepID=A0A132AM31_SARSC|nr:Importin-7 [Sarcoptes scabiei]KPM11645.1 importin-7-like protein [Sarcoptes scabiei]UXI19034.1 deoxyribose-phosphate aldolase [Sarcoptes scabiei]
MNILKLVEIFKNTLDNNHDEAIKQLDEIHKIIGFLPTVLQIVMESTIELSIRQAAVVYLKNEIYYYWEEKEMKKNEPQYSIHEQDRNLIRNSIVDALILSPDSIRSTLTLALNYIIKFDFPHKWTGIVDKVVYYLQSPEPNNCLGACLALLQMTKIYEYRSLNEKGPLIDAMEHIEPLIYSKMVTFLPNESEISVWTQKTILKLLYTFTQYSLPLKIFTHQVFTKWMEIICQVLNRPVPEHVNNVDIEERYELPWYKVKKWALHFVVRIFERYGPSKDQNKEYSSFSQWYIQTFSIGLIQVILKMLDQYSQQVYLPPRVLQQCINYLTICVEHLATWKMLKPNISQIIEKVIFPLMCYTKEDDELWKIDPEEYVRKKFDFFEDYVSPVSAAQQFLSTCCKKRKDMLKDSIAFAIQILNSTNSLPTYKDGALNMLGSVADIMLKKKIYKRQINDLLMFHVFPYFQSEQPYLRARAAWMLHFFEDYNFTDENTLFLAINCLQSALVNDKELPVKVQAAISLQILIINQEKSKPLIEQNLDVIVLECLNIIKMCQNDDVSSGLQRIICAFGEKILPISVKIVERLVEILEAFLETSDENNDITITLMGLLSNIDTILMLIDDKEMLKVIEPYAIKSVLLILNKNLNELYEECFNIVATLTEKDISDEMWQIYDFIHQISTKDEGVDYFSDMLSSLHNYLTVDPKAFISDPNRVVALFNICKFILSSDCIEDIYCNALKMIEVFFLEFRDHIFNYIPSFCEIVMDKYLCPSIETQEMKNLCLQIFLVVLYLNHDLFFEIIAKLQAKYPGKNLGEMLLENWLLNLKYFTGLHDRKVCILALCKLLSLPRDRMPPMVMKLAPKFGLDVIEMFENLKESYKEKANANAESDDDDTESIISYDDEDDIVDDETNNNNNNNNNNTSDMNEDDDSTDDYYDSDDDLLSNDENKLTALENFETTIDKEDSIDDEYVIFRNTVESLKMNDPNLYNLLFGELMPNKLDNLKDIFTLAQRRKDAAESRQIEQRGGYLFANQTIPTNFNFGGNFTNNFANNH